MASEYSWVPSQREYDMEKQERQCKSVPTEEHPLRGTVVTNLSSKGTKEKKKEKPKEQAEMLDPLSMMATQTFEGIDPLSMMLQEQTLEEKKKEPIKSRFSQAEITETEEEYIDDSFEAWTSKKINILSKYTTSERLSITTSFLSGTQVDKAKQMTTTATDKMKTRLEQLDDFEEGSLKEMLNLSQQDYVNKIDDLNQELLKAWGADQRVKSLKISIQCAKLLGDISVMPFYPSKFVLVTDILDNFGTLVYERIKSKSVIVTGGSNKPVPLPDDFTPDQVPESAKETCRNWFYKVASIRELIPRLYVEMAILKCYNFLTKGEYYRALTRLVRQIRGIGNPLVACYARAYLCRVGMNVAPKVKDHQKPCVFDFLFSYGQMTDVSVQNSLAKQGIEMPKYLQLYAPAVEWILQCISFKASEEVLAEILENCKSCHSTMVLNSVMSSFDPAFISKRAMEISALIKECDDFGLPKSQLYKTLGNSVTVADPPESDRLSLLNEVWKVVTKIKDPAVYIEVADAWIEYPIKHFTARELNTLLGDIIKHMTPDRAFEDHYPQLISIVSKVVSNMKDFNALFQMEKFLPFLDMFQKESMKVDACKTIMEAFIRFQKEDTTDPVIINALTQICKTMHDSVNSLSLEDNRRFIGNLISRFVQTVDYGRDFEQQLNFYVLARDSFTNLDNVLTVLVQRVNSLAMRTRDIVKGNHTRKTAAFVRACMAYCFITIPSMIDIFQRLKLYLLSGQVALANQAIGQADAFLRTAVNLIAEVPATIEIDLKARTSEPYLKEFIYNLLSTLLVVPDHPEHGTLYLFRGLLNVVQDYAWEESSDARARVYLNAIVTLSASCQDSYLYQIDKVDSNDKLYGADKKFIAEVVKIVDTLLKQVLEDIISFGEKNPKVQGQLLIALINRIIISADLESPQMTKLALNLWKKAQDNPRSDGKLMGRILRHVKEANQNKRSFQDLAIAMTQPSRA
ncbi:VPS35 endosomal protein-sorting factor-like isoform X3 [Rhopilema esculentum]|uniref:VPS35 endosomal protein-sorting factor-like isoform X2 n=1 Tax=Rhopilema esculentum TaxID=499914 RepID=UPI0031E37ED2